jgi:cobalamin synthase
MKYLFHSTLGGITGDCFGAANEVNEAAVLLTFCSIQRLSSDSTGLFSQWFIVD